MWGNGPCLVLAGPGSGKTFVLVNRILKLIENGANPESILIITFTRAAATEMKERFKKLLLEENVSVSSIPTFGTFHSVFYEILRNDFGYASDSLLNDDDEKKILFSVIEKREDISVNLDSVSNILSDIGAYKMALERTEKFSPKYLSKDVFFEIYDKYIERLHNQKKLDFFDMIARCGDLLKNHEDVLEKYKKRYEYFLIDEFQDINKSQYDIVRLICGSNNIFVVGDDDQSIYKFRGSRPSVMRDFLFDFKGAETIKLNENYRCAKIIVKYSKKVIDNNIDRFEKDLQAKRDDAGKLEIKAFDDSLSENYYIVDKIRYYRSIGIEYSDMAVLYRTNLLSNAVSKVLRKHLIPCDIKGENTNIYDNFAIKDILSYLKIADGSNDISDFVCIANKPLRYISRDSMGYTSTNIDDLIKYYKNSDFVLNKLSKLKYDLKVIKNKVTPLAIRYIRKDIGYDEYLKKYCTAKKIDFDEVSELLDFLEEDSIGKNSIKDYLKYVIDESSKVSTDINSDCVSLMTFHTSKGLEFKVVFIIDANDQIIPHKRSIKDSDIETERRLFYVAMTRAKDFLHIFYTSKRLGKNYKVSRFVLEILGGKDG